MDLEIGGKVALVMGSSKGLGRATAIALANEGAQVAITGRSQERLDVAAGEVGEGTVTLVTDTDDLDGLAQLPGRVKDALGPIDILVLNTGGPPAGGALDHGIDEWQKAYRSLVLAPKILIDEIVPGMQERGWGRVVNVGSIATREPIPNLNLSNSHRMATVGFLKTLASEVAADGVTVNTIATGRFATERYAELVGSREAAEEVAAREVPAGRLGAPEEFADLVAFVCSARAAYLTGTVLPLDGGLTRPAF
jgi:3-oxoacyl-[acyl-carrier protein] reductase